MAEPMSDTRILQKPRKTKKTKKTQVLTPCQILGHRFCLFAFLVLPPKTKKTKRNQKYWPHARYWDIGSAFLFFLFFWFYLQKPKKQKKVLTPCQILGHRFCLFVFFGFSRFWILGHGSCHFVFFVFFVFSRFWILGHGFCDFVFWFFKVFDPSQQRKQSDLHCKRWMHIRHRDV